MTLDNMQMSIQGNDWSLEGNGSLAENAMLVYVNGRRDFRNLDVGWEAVWRNEGDAFGMVTDERGRDWFVGKALCYIMRTGRVWRYSRENPVPAIEDAALLIRNADVGYRVNRDLPLGTTADDVPTGMIGGYMVEFFGEGVDSIDGGTWRFGGLRRTHYGLGESLDSGPGQIIVNAQRVNLALAWAR